MKIRNLVKVFAVLLLCLLPTMAMAAQRYDSTKIYFDEIPTQGVIFKSGDTLSGGRGITVSVSYSDAEGNVIETGGGTIKSVSIGGQKVSEWVLTSKSGAYVSMNDIIFQAAYDFTMIPAYAAADAEGYYTISEKTYGTYAKDDVKSGKQVKLTGTVIVNDVVMETISTSVDDIQKVAILAIAEDLLVAIRTDVIVDVDKRFFCKGKVAGVLEYENINIPVVECTEVTLQQYETLKWGDSSPDVKAMKERMRTLGYFSATAELSDLYNDICVERVQMFQKRNGLPATGIADVETLTLLYSDAAKSK